MQLQALKKWLVRDPLVWSGIANVCLFLARFPGVNRLFESLLFEKCCMEKQSIENALKVLIPERKVLSGPFRGLAYPTLDSAGSMLAPKLLGVYESELHPIFEDDYLDGFSTIVDVGCAEGYYAVGIATITNRPMILAFDTCEQARSLCRANACFNQVESRVIVKPTCTAAELGRLDGERLFIISDCEGAEMTLFTVEVIDALRNSDILIEVHEHLGANLDTLSRRFGSTHDVKTIVSQTDLDKLKNGATAVCSGNAPLFNLMLVAECRPRRMHWLYARSRTDPQAK